MDRTPLYSIFVYDENITFEIGSGIPVIHLANLVALYENYDYREIAVNSGYLVIRRRELDEFD